MFYLRLLQQEVMLFYVQHVIANLPSGCDKSTYINCVYRMAVRHWLMA